MTLVGPLFRHELTRLARRGLQPKLRAAFAGLLLGALLLTYLKTFPGQSPVRVLVGVDRPLSIEEAARFGERFLDSFLVVQMVVIVVITPAVAGSAIAEEKERGSLDFLLCSPLSSREIVLGKLAARLLFVVGVLITGLPVLVLTMFFGGVDFATLLAGYALTLLTVLSHGAFALYLSVKFGDLRRTLSRAYAAVVGLAVFGFCCGWCLVVPALPSPFASLFYLLVGTALYFRPPAAFELWVVGAYAAVHIPLTVWFVARAARLVRQSPEYRPPPGASRPVGFVEPAEEPLPLGHPGVTRLDLRIPRLQSDEDPLLWKETWFGPRLLPPPESPAHLALSMLLLFAGGIGLMVLTSVTATRIERGGPLGDIYGPLGRAMAAALLPLLVLGVGLLAAGSVATERQRQTLDGLLALPGSRSEVLRAKAVAALRALRVPAFLLAGFFAAGFLTAGFPLITLLTGPVLAVGWVAAALGFGMWVSVRSRTPARATGYFLAALLAVSFLPPLAAPMVRDVLVEAVVAGLSPVWGAWNGLPDRGDWDAATRSAAVGLAGSQAGAIVAMLAGAACWWAARRRFETEGR
jgi:ABC-type transport system involved in multi-copper enzyme maturation permease subunit